MVDKTTDEGGLSEQVFRHCAPTHKDEVVPGFRVVLDEVLP